MFNLFQRHSAFGDSSDGVSHWKGKSQIIFNNISRLYTDISLGNFSIEIPEEINLIISYVFYFYYSLFSKKLIISFDSIKIERLMPFNKKYGFSFYNYSKCKSCRYSRIL